MFLSRPVQRQQGDKTFGCRRELSDPQRVKLLPSETMGGPSLLVTKTHEQQRHSVTLADQSRQTGTLVET